MKPILFNTQMVQAILEGRKTQTRRIAQVLPADQQFRYDGKDEDGFHYVEMIDQSGRFTEKYIPIGKPNYEPGDVLWVRETFTENKSKVFFKADNPDLKTRWKPSIFMPKKSARIFLKVKTLKIERLQDISNQDAIEEGIIKVKCNLTGKLGFLKPNNQDVYKSPVNAFWSLWDSIHGAGSWKQNPFIWVYEFERTKKPDEF